MFIEGEELADTKPATIALLYNVCLPCRESNTSNTTNYSHSSTGSTLHLR